MGGLKRKRSGSDSSDSDVKQCDLVLTDAKGRSIRVHRQILVNASDYFAKILADTNLLELRLDETYLIELIRYLYRFERERKRPRTELDVINHQHVEPSAALNTAVATTLTPDRSDDDDEDVDDSYGEDNDNNGSFYVDSDILHGDIEILMQLLVLSERYHFRQLYRDLMAEINYMLRPSSVVVVFECASRLSIKKLEDTAKLMILSWLPQIYKTRPFLRLSEKAIRSIFASEAPEVDNECKLNALSAWWSKNQDADMTNLWVTLITCNNSNNK